MMLMLIQIQNADIFNFIVSVPAPSNIKYFGHPTNCKLLALQIPVLSKFGRIPNPPASSTSVFEDLKA
jgi:hypothetical protein